MFIISKEYIVDTMEQPMIKGGHGQTDGRTDIYCLGATMYHLVTGHNPSQPPYEMYPIRNWDPNLSSGLEEIIIKCTKYKLQCKSYKFRIFSEIFFMQ